MAHNFAKTNIPDRYLVKDTGVHLPSVTKTAWQSTFENYKLGWFICYGMETYTGNESDSKCETTAAPSTFTPTSVDVKQWATLAKASGRVDYAILTVCHVYGFSLLNHQRALWNSQQTNPDTPYGLLPDYLKYDVGATNCSNDICRDFVREFKAVGISTILYHIGAWQRNWYGRKYYLEGVGFGAPLYPYQSAENHFYLKKRLQELTALNPDAIWFDIPQYYQNMPNTTISELYYAVKAQNPNMPYIINCAGDIHNLNNTFFPMDGASLEENLLPNAGQVDHAWWTKQMTFGGITYPCVKEISASTRTNYKWYYKYPSPEPLRTLASIQASYNKAKAIGVPIALSVNPKLDGVLDQDQVDLINSIVL